MTSPELLRPVLGRLVPAAVLQALAGVSALLPLLALARFAGAWASGDALPGTTIVVTAVAGTVGAALAAAAATWITHRADADLSLHLQRRLAETIRHAPVPAVQGQGAARIKKVVQDDTGALHYLVAHTLLDVVALVVVPIAGFAVLAAFDWRLALCSLVPLVAGVLFYARAMRGSGAQFAEYAVAQQRINAAVVDYVRGLPVAKVYGGPGGARTRFLSAATGFHDFFRAWSSGTAVVTTASWLVVTPGLTATGLTVLGVIGVTAGWLTPSAMVAGVLLGPAISAPVAVAGPRLQAIRTGLSALSSIREFLEQPALRFGTRGSAPAGSVRLERISHRYDGDRLALDDVSFDLPPTGLVAVVGASGSGKSTLAALLARFADPTSGRILIGGTALTDLTEKALYDHTAFVFQDTGMRRASVRDNLTGGRAVTDEEMAGAARDAAIHDEITALAHGYDTVLGVDTELSGGQIQRLCLARALVRSPRLLVLDEALSAVDAASRSVLLDMLEAQAEHRSVLLITHQLDIAARADRVLVLADGRLAGDGTAAELSMTCPAYQALTGDSTAHAEGRH
ncbi:ATP-binding cassette, subfamily B [Micromonospora marina]|uniref:ATP-binding cassette, subfamily B n=1 Tax=Micromonospora marina TaxID=307120 RepID=A0A1C5A7R1_9ACTN|nr:ATP-binding cassette, subfamily B [Micromonospora marina]